MSIYQLSREAVINALSTNEKHGLTEREVGQRLRKYGYNIMPEAPRPSLLRTFVSQFENPLIYLLLVAAVIITLLGNYTDAIVTVIVVLFNAVIGTVYERNAQRTLQNLKKLITISCVVVRDGKRSIVEAKELVPGDVILLSEGDQVPADVRVIEADGLSVNESVLTGESVSVEKNSDAIDGEKPIFEQRNMLFRGTTVTSGAAIAIVVLTGAETEVGKLQKLTQEYETHTPLQVELEKLSKRLAIFAIGLCSALFVIGLLSHRPFTELLGLVVALFIGIVPEGLPVVFALTLITGARRLARRQVLVKRLAAAEGLGRVDVIVIDKTGTLTRNEMVVRSAYVNGDYYTITGEGYFPEGEILKNGRDAAVVGDLEALGIAADFLDSSEKKYVEKAKSYQIKGEPTEAAIGVFAQKVGASLQGYNLLHELPFDFKLRVRLTFAEKNGKLTVFVSGAPETIFGTCEAIPENTQKALDDFLSHGYRTVAIAAHELPMPANITSWLDVYTGQCHGKCTFLGLLGIQDAIRPEVHDAVLKARSAGIDVVMATGDHKSTATHIAQDTGIMLPGDKVMTGAELISLSPDDIAAMDVDRVKVFARVTPQDKLMIVNLFKSKGKVVAMTGDGINDVPSLAASDIGISMGLAGTDVAKEAADIVLMDDSFTSIVKGVEEGRHIFSVLRRVVWYFFSTNLSELLVIVSAFLFDAPLPLRAAQILWLNVVTDGFLDVALAMEPHERGLLTKKASSLKRSLFDLSLLSKISIDAVVMTVGTIGVFFWYKDNIQLAQTMVLLTLAMFQWFNAWNCRSEKESIFKRGLFTNPWLIGATLLVFILQLLVIYLPAFQYLFKTVPVSIYQWLAVMLITSSILVVEEVRKAVVGRWPNAG